MINTRELKRLSMNRYHPYEESQKTPKRWQAIFFVICILAGFATVILALLGINLADIFN